MTKDEIIKEVTDYIKDDRDNYAILINGAWGIGKTFLYENYLEEAINKIEVGKNNRKTCVYLSLYGIDSIQELSRQLTNCYVAYSKMGLNVSQKAIYDKAGRIISLFSKSISFSAPYIDINPEGFIDGIKELVDIKDLVICFDDLERCEISINSLFGFINNLVEHCNCKVILLADEENIGKMYANYNLPEKYLSILTGGRKVVISKRKSETDSKDELNLSIDELKKFNEKIYSENYVYKDIKEKVVKKTFFYSPSISEVIIDVVNEKDKIRNLQYIDFIKANLNNIITYFEETKTNNIRVILYWISEFEKIYLETEKLSIDPRYNNKILMEFVRYSIWVVVSYKQNKRINVVDTARLFFNGQHYNYVFFEDKDYTTLVKIDFLDAWIRRGVKDIDDLKASAETIKQRIERDEIYSLEKPKSKGKALGQLLDFCYMDDNEVEALIQLLIQEIKENKYVYDDYSQIIKLLMILEEIGFTSFNIKDEIAIMIDLTKKDLYPQEGHFNMLFDDEDLYKSQYKTEYERLKKERAKRNKELNVISLEEKFQFDSVKSFCEKCKQRAEYYESHKSFTSYVNIDDIVYLVQNTDQTGVHDIRNIIHAQYHMGNVKEFFEADTDDLLKLHKKLNDNTIIDYKKGKTYLYAIKLLDKSVVDILHRLDCAEIDSVD